MSMNSIFSLLTRTRVQTLHSTAYFYGCINILLIYNHITIYVNAPHSYDLTTLVGCWSSVSIRMIIFNFRNVYPFDYTVFAVSGKVERS